MPPACQDVTVFPHRSHLCVHTSAFVRRRRVTRCHDWLTGFIYNYAVFYFRLVGSGEMHVSARPPAPSPLAAFAVAWKCDCYFCTSRDWNVDCVKARLLTFLGNFSQSPMIFALPHMPSAHSLITSVSLSFIDNWNCPLSAPQHMLRY